MTLERIRGLIGIFCVLAAIFLAFREYTDDTPTEEFIKVLVKKNGATKVLHIYDRFKVSVGSGGRSKKIVYTYRAFDIEKDVDLNGKIIHQLVHGQVRCYIELQTWNPFDTEPQENYCRYHELRQTPPLNPKQLEK